MSDDWYIYKSNKAQGPLTERQVRAALAAGRIMSETPLRRGVSGAWIPAERALADSTKPGGKESKGRKSNAPSSGEIHVIVHEHSRLPLVLAAVVGVVALLGVMWGAFELGRRQPGPAVTSARSDA